MLTLREVITKVQEGSEYKRYSSVISSVKAAINLSSISKEASYLHSKRETTKLYKLKLDPMTVAKANLLDLSNRARLTELRADLHKQYEIVETANARLKQGIRAQWETRLKKLASTAVQRNAIIERLCTDGVDLQAQIEATSKLLDSFIKDIDQAGFSIRNTVDLLKMLVERRDQTI